MNAKRFQWGPAWEDTPLTILARLCAKTATGSASPVPEEGNLLLQADVTSVTCKIYDEGGTIVISTTPTTSDVVYDTLQTTGVWKNLARGGNFLYTIPATGFPSGLTEVTVEITLTLSSGEPLRLIGNVKVLNLVQS